MNELDTAIENFCLWNGKAPSVIYMGIEIANNVRKSVSYYNLDFAAKRYQGIPFHIVREDSLHIGIY